MASLLPGIRIAEAPRFHASLSWPDRLGLSSGAIVEANRVYARNDWRPATADELATLIAEAPGPATLVLFSIPEHLRQGWWNLNVDPTTGADPAAFNAYARQLLDYFHFKQVPLPANCCFEVMVAAPGRPSTRPDQGGLASPPPLSQILGGVNLGDETASLVLLNIHPDQLRSHAAEGASFGQAVNDFLKAQQDYPLVRVALNPGDGYWLPPIPIAADGDTRGRTEIDVHLWIRAG